MFELKKFLNLDSFRALGAPFAGFDKILNWKLLRGSHVFPGPDGGTCVNEAAIIAAGHPYRAVRSVEDCPASFSPPAAAYAMFLNDLIEDDELRHRVLLPFVNRLENSAATREIEKARAELIVLQTASAVLAPALLRLGNFEASDKFRLAGSTYELIGLAREYSLPASPETGEPRPSASMAQVISELGDAAYACLRNDFVTAAKCAAIVAGKLAQNAKRPKVRRNRRAKVIFYQARHILDAALKLGGSGEIIGLSEAAARLAAARRKPVPFDLALS